MSAPPPLPTQKSFSSQLSILLPFRRYEYQTVLTANQIGQCFSEHVITGFSILSPKEYYGEYTAYSFSVRKVASKLKKQSLGPTLAGDYGERDGRMLVTLRITPHPAAIVALVVFAFPILLYFCASIPEAFKTGNPGVLLDGFVPFALLYGIWWAIFHSQCRPNRRFWEHTLQLREIKVER